MGMRQYDLGSELETRAAHIVDAAIRVHTALGPGLLESVYEACLAYELSKRGLDVRTQVPVPVVYDGVRLETGLRIDLWLDELIVIEIKAVEAMIPVFDAQLLTYLKLTGCRLGFLINFNVPRVKQGIKRMVLTPG